MAHLCGGGAMLALLPHAGERPWRWAALAFAPLWFAMTLLLTADAPLLLGWSVALAGALRGGDRGWAVAGVGGAVAFLSKYTGLAVLPLAVLAVGPSEWRTRGPWLGLLVQAGLSLPHLAWSAAHDHPALRFQWVEGVANPHPEGAWGASRWLLEQAGALTPLVAVALVGALASRASWGGGRTERVLWATSAPVLLGFWLLSPLAPAEAHWTAPAWLGAALLAVRVVRGWVARAVDVGIWLAIGGTAMLVTHLAHPWLPMAEPLSDRFVEGQVFRWAMVSWYAPESPGSPPPLVLSERYQEAAFLRLDGVVARRWPACGRADQFTLVDRDPWPEQAVFVRPERGGGLTCVLSEWEVLSGPHRVDGRDERGRVVGRWQVFRLARASGGGDHAPVP